MEGFTVAFDRDGTDPAAFTSINALADNVGLVVRPGIDHTRSLSPLLHAAIGEIGGLTVPLVETVRTVDVSYADLIDPAVGLGPITGFLRVSACRHWGDNPNYRIDPPETLPPAEIGRQAVSGGNVVVRPVAPNWPNTGNYQFDVVVGLPRTDTTGRALLGLAVLIAASTNYRGMRMRAEQEAINSQVNAWNAGDPGRSINALYGNRLPSGLAL